MVCSRHFDISSTSIFAEQEKKGKDIFARIFETLVEVSR